MAIRRVDRNAHLAGSTAASAKVWGKTVGKKLAELLQPYLEEGETMPDAVLLQKLVGRLLDDSEKKLDASSLEAGYRQSSAAALRIHRDKAAKALREELRRARFFFDQVRGKGEVAKLGVGEGLSTMTPALLVRTGVLTASTLDYFEANVPRRETLPPAAALASAVREKTAALDEALKKLSPESESAATSRIRKNRDVAKTERTIRRSAAFLAGLYKLCDFDDFAKKIRPVFRRRRARKARSTQLSLSSPSTRKPASPPAGPPPAAKIPEGVPIPAAPARPLPDDYN